MRFLIYSLAFFAVNDGANHAVGLNLPDMPLKKKNIRGQPFFGLCGVRDAGGVDFAVDNQLKTPKQITSLGVIID